MERKIITTSNELRSLLVEFYEGRDWEARGHRSWNEWANKVAALTFGLSRVHIFRELLAGQIERELLPVGNNIGTLPERQLRPLAQLRDDPEILRETWARANEIAEEQEEPLVARHVTQAVQERTSPPAEPRRPAPMAVHSSSATPEWYTPQHIVQRVAENISALVNPSPVTDLTHGTKPTAPSAIIAEGAVGFGDRA